MLRVETFIANPEHGVLILMERYSHESGPFKKSAGGKR